MRKATEGEEKVEAKKKSPLLIAFRSLECIPFVLSCWRKGGLVEGQSTS